MTQKILAVDDEVLILKILRLHLEAAGYTVITANNGKEALAALKQHPDIDCILLDRMMPEMDGMETIERIKAAGSPYRHIPVIMQTAKKEDWDAYEGIDAGAIHYMIKPYVRETLLATVESVLRDVQAMREYYTKSK